MIFGTMNIKSRAGRIKAIINIAVCFLITVSIILSFAACTGADDKKDIKDPQSNVSETTYPYTITDSYDRTVTLDKEPEKVVSIAPNITEIIFALGEGQKLAGRTEYCDYPEEAKQVASIGTLQEPNIEKIVELKPDLVIASTHFQKESLGKMEEAGLKVAVLYGEESFEGVYDTIDKVGKVLNANKKAQSIIADMKKKVSEVKQKVKGKNTPSVYYVISYGQMGDFTAGKGTFIGKMIEMAGGKNAADDVEGWSYSLEKLVEKNPDIMICSMYYDTKKGIQSTNGYKDLDAVKNGKLFEIDNNLLDRQGPRLADGLVELAKIIHPESFR